MENDYTADEIMIVADLINALPRKRLGYRTPEELFDAELDRIFAAWSQRLSVRHGEFAFSLVAPLLPQKQIRSFCEFFVNYCNLLLQFTKFFALQKLSVFQQAENFFSPRPVSNPKI